METKPTVSRVAKPPENPSFRARLRSMLSQTDNQPFLVKANTGGQYRTQESVINRVATATDDF
jgi:hypothetical protein